MQELKRVIGTGGAVMMGLGAIIGSGVFVGIGLCAERSGSLVVAAIIVAALLATFNGLSSAQLAATCSNWKVHQTSK